jgi:hypothetical protein
MTNETYVIKDHVHHYDNKPRLFPQDKKASGFSFVIPHRQSPRPA